MQAVVLTKVIFSMEGNLGNVHAVIDVSHSDNASFMLEEMYSLGTTGNTDKKFKGNEVKRIDMVFRLAA
ncbi:MAG: hypothetical protein KAH20_03895 [Methylococcales bacterium]|nr:hypothetical protein [Methylococcales bacterium]